MTKVPRPTVRFIAVSEDTSNLWWLVMVGALGGLAFALAVAGLRALL